MNDEDAVAYLQALPEERLVEALRRVFAARPPAPDEEGYCRSHFVLGTAWSSLESEEGEPERWGPWELQLVAYMDRSEYGEESGFGPNWGLCQTGTCGTCGAAVCSNVKRGRCPVCDSPVYMT